MLLRGSLLKGGTNLRQCLFLHIDVETGRARLRNQQRPRAVAGEPEAVAPVRSALILLQPVDQLQHLAGRVSRQ